MKAPTDVVGDVHSSIGEDCMKGRMAGLAGLASLFVFVTGTAIGQQCSNVYGGPWMDNYGFQWYLGQSGSSVNGAVYTNCGGWYVLGTMNSFGQFDLNAYNPNPPMEGCGSWFRYVGGLEVGGCNVGDGTWTSAYTSNSFWWEKSCAVPSGETTHASDFFWSDLYGEEDDDSPFFLFAVTVDNTPNNQNLSGRDIREAEIGAVDYCWYEDSPYDPAGLSGLDERLFPSNEYPDLIGTFPDPILHYRAADKAPCSAVVHQRMEIACDDHGFFGTSTDWVGYQDNDLVYVIGVSPQNQIASERDEVLHPKTWP
jgi:hypothetical protein